MLTKLILLMMLVNLLTALPTSESNVPCSEEAWSVEKACETSPIGGMSLVPNQNDPTCSSYVYCYTGNGQSYALVKRCKSGQYFDDSIKMCVTTKPDVCA